MSATATMPAKASEAEKTVLVIGGTGKTGRRLAERLWDNGRPVRLGSRSGAVSFDWDDAATWPAALEGAAAAYVTYYPDLLMPEAADRIGALARRMVASGVERLVMLSGRGEPPGAERCEAALKASGAAWTVVRASWFAQNFSEGFFADLLREGNVALPVGPDPSSTRTTLPRSWRWR